jgi:formylglycine-generating enzyme required for sulfatase activity
VTVVRISNVYRAMRSVSSTTIGVVLLTLAASSLAEPAKANAGSKLEMIKIPGGDFQMGSEDGPNTRPVHKVTVASFELDKNLVTTAAFQACVDAKACQATSTSGEEHDPLCNQGQGDKANHPANCLKFSQASAFCAWAGKRLPTEEEWEYAARGTEGRKYPWGNEDPDDKRACWNRGSVAVQGDQLKGTCAVGAFPAGNTPLGLQDMAGNLAEWTSTPYSLDYTNSKKMTGDAQMVLRGGSWEVPNGKLEFAMQDMLTYTRRKEFAKGAPPRSTNGVRCAR